MDCKVVLQITNYNTETNKVEDPPKILGTIDSNTDLTVDYIVDLISKMSLEERSALAAQLRAAKAQQVTEDMLKKYEFVSNISLDDLVTIYPNLKNYKIPKDLQFKFTLINCRKFKVNGKYYHGRITKGDEEIYIVNNYYDADKLFKHLSVRLNLSKFIQGDEISQELKEFEEDLTVVASEYRKSVQKLIENFLINKQAYKPFRIKDRIYDPAKIINKALSKITGQVYDVGDKSTLQLALENIKDSKSTSNEWKMNKKKLYDVLCTFYPDFEKTYKYSEFNELSTESLNSVLVPLFKDDVKLMRATVQESEVGEKVTVKEALGETTVKKLPKRIIEQYYQNKVRPLDESLPKTLDSGLKRLGYDFITLLQSAGDLVYTDENSKTYPIKVSMDHNYKVTMSYEVPVEPVVREKTAYVTLNLHNWDAIGDVYGWGYDDQPLFTPTEYYKGFYIYEYNKDGVMHYVVSRSIISSEAYMKSFSDLKYAKSFIDNNKDTLRDCGLWSIKQHNGFPRVTELEMKQVREGQIISTLDIKLPNVDVDHLSIAVSDLLDKPLDAFYDRFNFVSNIKSLDTPEKAVAFLYLTHELISGENINTDYMNAVRRNKNAVQEMIKKINSAPTKHFKIERADIYSTKSKNDSNNKQSKIQYHNRYYLTLLRKDGVDVDLTGTFGGTTVQSFINQNLTDLANYYESRMGVSVKALSKSELEEFSIRHGLKLEDKINSVRAFVYNGTIYLNTSIANSSDLFHELSHILLGSLKASEPDMYKEIIKHYQDNTINFDRKVENKRKAYEHYSYQDVVEETVADLIADTMFKFQNLGEFKLDEIFMTYFKQVLNKSNQFIKSKPDNEMGFSNYIKTLINNNTNAVQRNMRISELVKRYIEEERIKEDCKYDL